MNDANGSVTLVTGSARGLGLAVARFLRDRGDRVHVCWRTDNERARALQDEFGPRAHRADLLDESHVQSLISGVLGVDGRLDHLVHAVGEYVSGPLAEATQEDLRRMWRSNTESSFLLMNAARDALREARGRAVFFGCSGLQGFRGRRITAVYASAKSALFVLVRSWALEEARHGVTVNMVSPGHVPHDDAHPDTLDAKRLEEIPAGRPGKPEDIAQAVAHLCSPAAEYTTGADLLVTGGYFL